MKFLVIVVLAFMFPTIASASWTQEAGNPQRTGYSSTQPGADWQLAWTWNGPDSNGGTGEHFYDIGHNATKSPIWEGRTIATDTHIFVPALSEGLFGLNKSDGSVAWNYINATFKATPAYDAATNTILAGATNGVLYKFAASTGQLLDTYSAGSQLNKAVLIADNHAYVTDSAGRLHKVNIHLMESVWVFAANADSATPPSYSTRANLIIYATKDLYVHAVDNITGEPVWEVKPSSLTPSDYITFEGYWPVVAEQAGVVFVRMNVGGEINSMIFNGPGTGNKWPTTNAEIKTYLAANPEYKNLFALDLESGQEAFIPAVGPGGTESLLNNNAIIVTGPVPVIKPIGDREVAYIHFRNGQTKESWYDGRWDSHLGEMVLDNATVPGYTAGDLRFVQFDNSFVHITDEQNALTMAGNTIFHSHWGALESNTLTDRSNSRGLNLTDPIRSVRHNTLIRRMQSCGSFNPLTHYTTCGLTLFDDGRYWQGPGFWTYWNQLDPPTPSRGAYSEGILPRYAYVTGQLVVTQGNGGELLVFRHLGTIPSPSATPTPSATAYPTPTPDLCPADINQDGITDLTDYSLLAVNFLSTTPSVPRADINQDGIVDLTDYSLLAVKFLQLCSS